MKSRPKGRLYCAAGSVRYALLALCAFASTCGFEAVAASSGDVVEVPDPPPPKALHWDLWATGLYQGLVSGDGRDDYDGSGRIDLMARADTGAMGLWQGGSLNAHLTFRDGNASPFRGGALLPVDTAVLLPLDSEGDLVATSLYVGQRIGSKTNLLVGKIDAVDLLAAHPFFGGWGTERFRNIAFVAPPSGVVPPVIIGGVVTHAFPSFKLTGMVFDPNDQTRNYKLSDLFADGTNVSLGLSWGGAIADRPATFGTTATYSTADGRDWRDFGLPPGIETTNREGSWNVAFETSLLLAENGVTPGKGLGLYAKAALADGNPNLIRASFVGGIAGHGMIGARPADSFGVGVFHYNFSDELQDVVAEVSDFDDEQGIEVFYSMALAPWLRITADLQWIDPATAANDAALLAGLRVRIAP